MKTLPIPRSIIIALFSVALVGAGWSAIPAARAAPIEIKFAHVDTDDPFTSKKGAASHAFEKIVEAESAGRVEVKLFPAGQLGGERELVEATKIGTIQMCMVSAAIAGYFKEGQVLDIPYLFSSAPVAWKVMDGWFGKELSAECLKKTGMRNLAYGETGFRNFTNSRGPIRRPEDMKGLKIRVMESPVYLTLVKSLGAAPTPIAWPEVYTSLQQKVVDGQENPVSVIIMGKLYEVQKYLTLDGHTYGCDFMLINEKFFQKLPKDIQGILKTTAITAGYCGRSIQQLNSALGLAKLKEAGMEIYSPSPEERAAFREATQKPVMKLIEEQIGRKWVDKVQKAVKEVEAELSK